MPTMADMAEPDEPTNDRTAPPEGAAPPDEPAPSDRDGAAELPPIDDESRRAIEAVLMVAEHPVEAGILAQLVERSAQQVEDLLAGLAASYEEDGRGFQLVRVAGGWRFQSHEALSPYVERFIIGGQTARLSAAALETLSIVAYKQPISRAQVSAIRGVNVDGVMRTLQQRGYIAEVGKDAGPGQPSMFGTTALFLEKLGLNAVDELPSLGDFIPGADVVELLEHGLRATGDDPVAPTEQVPATTGESDGGAVVVEHDTADVDGTDLDGMDVDLTAVVDLTDLRDRLDELDGTDDLSPFG